MANGFRLNEPSPEENAKVYEAVLNWVRAQRGTVKGAGIVMRVVGGACFVIDHQHQEVRARGVEPKTLAMGQTWTDVAKQLKIEVE